jgi:hypothetical protein
MSAKLDLRGTKSVLYPVDEKNQLFEPAVRQYETVVYVWHQASPKL